MLKSICQNSTYICYKKNKNSACVLCHVQLFVTLDCSPSGSSVHRICQARMLEWVAYPPPGDRPSPGIEPMSPAPTGGFFTTEPPGSSAATRTGILLPRIGLN